MDEGTKAVCQAAKQLRQVCLERLPERALRLRREPPPPPWLAELIAKLNEID